MHGLHGWTVYLLGHMIHLGRVDTAPADPCSSICNADHMLHLHQQLPNHMHVTAHIRSTAKRLPPG